MCLAFLFCNYLFSLRKENFFSIYSSMILCPTPTTDPHAFSLLLQWFYACFKFLYLFPFVAPYWLLLALSYHAHSLSLRFNSSCHWIPPFISVRISLHPNLPPFPIQHMVLLSLHSLWVLSACSAPEDILLLTEILLFHLTLLPLSSYTLQHRVSQTMKTASSRFGFCDFPHKQFRLFYICESPGVQVNSLLGSDFFHKRKSLGQVSAAAAHHKISYVVYTDSQEFCGTLVERIYLWEKKNHTRSQREF